MSQKDPRGHGVRQRKQLVQRPWDGDVLGELEAQEGPVWFGQKKEG